MRTVVAILGSLTALFFLSRALFGDTYTVVNTADAGGGSLRQAILDANAHSNSANPGGAQDLIAFAIPGDGPHTIFPASPLPTITDPVIVDGYTQGSSTPQTSDDAAPNTLAVGDNAVIKILLSGNGAPTGSNGLVITAGNSTVRGLQIKGFAGIYPPASPTPTPPPTGGAGIVIRTNGGNVIEGNIIGGNFSPPNTIVDPNTYGIEIGDRNGNGAPNNIIGGAAPGSRNIISGNRETGLNIWSASSSGNQVLNNYVGVDRDGVRRLSNKVGIHVGGPGNIIGGTTDGARNIISGSTDTGLGISGNGNTVQGNYIGTDATGTMSPANLGNHFVGIFIGVSSNNIIGGTAPGARNIISGNDAHEIRVEADSVTPASGNKIVGNYIGTDKTGTVSLAHSFAGVDLDQYANGNTIGGTEPGAGNVISGHTGHELGMFVCEGNVVQGNLIGTDVTGKKRMGGSFSPGAVALSNAQNNLIGGSAPGALNIISGVDGYGVVLESSTGRNKVQGNFIGTDITGAVSLGNGTGGILVNPVAGEGENTIGGTQPGEGNLVSGNTGHGITLSNAPFDGYPGTNVLGNFIGTDVNGTSALPNTLSGVFIQDSPGNFVGGTSAGSGNVISGNDGNGIFVTGAASQDNHISQNLIGRNAANDSALGNKGHGILLQSAGPNTIGGGFNPNNANTIAHNGGDGVAVVFGSGPSIKEGILSNSIFSNGGLGIDLEDDGVTPNDVGDGDSGANTLQNYPVLTTASVSGGNTTIKGSLNSTANTSFHLEFFASRAADPSGYGEGQTFLGFKDVTTDGNGNVNFNAVLAGMPPAGQASISATATDNAELANTSEFSNAIPLGNPPGQLLNIATRVRVQTGENVLIGGFIVTGTDQKKVIIRGIGPSLSAFFSGVLANPTLELFQGNTLLQSNDDWRTDQQAEIAATGIPPSNDLEAAIVRTLPPGAYTAIVRGKNNTTGIGVVEAYDLAQAANSKLANIATRGFVDTNENVMIGGLIAGPDGGGTTRVIVRAIGPSLGNFGIAGALQDSTLELVNSSGTTIRSNDDWKLGGQQAELAAAGLTPGDDRESALIETVPPGNYTAIVRGKGTNTGVGLVEVYDVP